MIEVTPSFNEQNDIYSKKVYAMEAIPCKQLPEFDSLARVKSINSFIIIHRRIISMGTLSKLQNYTAGA